MAGPIKKILEDFVGTIVSFTWEKIEKNRKMNSKFFGPKMSNFGPLQMFKYLS